MSSHIFILIIIITSFTQTLHANELKWLKDYKCDNSAKNTLLLGKIDEIQLCKYNIGLRGCAQLTAGTLFSGVSAISAWSDRRTKVHLRRLKKEQLELKDLKDGKAGDVHKWNKIKSAMEKNNKALLISLLKQYEMDDFIKHVENNDDLVRLGTSTSSKNPEEFLKQKVVAANEEIKAKEIKLSELESNKLTAKAHELNGKYDFNSSKGKYDYNSSNGNLTLNKNFEYQHINLGKKLLSFAKKWGGPALLVATGGEIFYNYKTGRNIADEIAFSLPGTTTGCATRDEQFFTTDSNCQPVLKSSDKTENFKKLDVKERDALFLQSTKLCQFYKDLYAQEKNSFEAKLDNIPAVKNVTCGHKNAKLSFVDNNLNLKDLSFDFSASNTEVNLEYSGGNRIKDSLSIDSKSDQFVKRCSKLKSSQFGRSFCANPGTRNKITLKKSHENLQFARLLVDFAEDACSDPTFPKSIRPGAISNITEDNNPSGGAAN